ncbi:MAG: hypothetical protein ACLVF9_05835 [Enterocloster sp.]
MDSSGSGDWRWQRGQQKHGAASSRWSGSRKDSGSGTAAGMTGHGIGRSVAAAGMDGEKLRQIRYVAERNGRHSLAVVYPGCYIAVSVSRDMHDPASIAVYRVEGFQETEPGVYQARAARVYQMEPYYSSLSEAQEKRLERLIRVSVWIATTPDLYKLRDKV